MNEDLERGQVIYGVLKTQIQFGAYRCGDILPTMENAASCFLVSLDTMRSAYLRLQREGYITLSQNVGSAVIKDCGKQDIEDSIQQFFSLRKSALIDLSKSLRPLLSQAQWFGLKNASENGCRRTQQLTDTPATQPFIAFHHIMQAYDALGNDLLLRLVWQIFMFYEAPFFCIPDNPWRTYAVTEYAPRTLDLCLRHDWDSLRESICGAQDSLSLTLCQFYEKRITEEPGQEISFSWSSYKKTSQLCYSLAMDLLISISRGQYPVCTLLPSLNKLSMEKNVSVSTVRRAISLLNWVGAVKSFKGIGTRVLPFTEAAENCDFTKTAVQKRLLGMAQSLHILTLSCRAVSELMVSSLHTAELQSCREHLAGIKERRQYELITYAALDLLRQYAPFQSIRVVYTELLRQLFWGYPLRSMWETGDDRIHFYLSCFEDFDRSLEKADGGQFSEKLEELMVHEFHFTIRSLIQLGISGVNKLLASVPGQVGSDNDLL